MASVIIVVMVDITRALVDQASRLGFNMIGVIPARPAKRLAAYHRWIALHYHGQMSYMARQDRIARRDDPAVILPNVASIVCVGLEYGGLVLPDHIARDPGRGRISNYAWAADYHEVMSPKLEALANWLVEASGSQATTRVYVDTGAILERDHGETAGLGFTGKNTMLIAPRSGSFFFLGEILTTQTLRPAEPQRELPTCGTCHRCLDACPTGAFPLPYVLDSRRCISYLTIELKGWIPIELRPLMGNWVYGCDICQNVCPFNRFAIKDENSPFQAESWEAAAPPLLELLALDQVEFDKRFSHSPIKRIKRKGLIRNACVAVGNWGAEAAVPLLSQLLHDEEAIIRGHAAWALGQIGSQEARRQLAKALAREPDSQVKAEINLAVDSI